MSFQVMAAPSHLVLMVISSEGNLFSGSPSLSLDDASQWWECVSAQTTQSGREAGQSER